MAATMRSVAAQAVVAFSTSLNCPSSAQQTFEGSCDFCADPPGDFASVLVTGIASDIRVSVHNEDNCGASSQVGQGFGPACWDQGHTAIRSVWIGCPGM
ncbi:hypothetical protein B0H17DRAFT_1206320 [Mycena rosella]|uniref:Uncharacterized protein n=1 Tax=Mycena rosella TaxID=1033263 RepID=A0AAD7D8R6_MYCRO|nr:hypothetical protein B0H17DRAFT_1206320 [Mycena rosella]